MATSGPTSGQSTTSSLTSNASQIVRDTANSQLGQQKQRATDLLGDVARAVRTATQQMEQGDGRALANYANRAADQIDRWSNGLRNRELDDLARDVRRFAREQPALFLGAAFGLGVLAARFLKSSSDRASSAGRDQAAMQEQLSETWNSTTASGTTRPYVAHDMPDVTGTPRLSEADIDLERP